MVSVHQALRIGYLYKRQLATSNDKCYFVNINYSLICALVLEVRKGVIVCVCVVMCVVYLCKSLDSPSCPNQSQTSLLSSCFLGAFFPSHFSLLCHLLHRFTLSSWPNEGIIHCLFLYISNDMVQTLEKRRMLLLWFPLPRFLHCRLHSCFCTSFRCSVACVVWDASFHFR